jgi:hypothetical protein
MAQRSVLDERTPLVAALPRAAEFTYVGHDAKLLVSAHGTGGEVPAGLGSSAAGSPQAASLCPSASPGVRGQPGAGKAGSADRLVSLDQFRGATMVAMVFVNYSGGFAAFPPLLHHSFGGSVGVALPDLVMPAFLFCAGYALRLTAGRRVARAGGSRLRTLWALLSSRCIGLVVCQAFIDRNLDDYGSWGQVAADGVGGWIAHLLRSPYAYGTLTQIAFTSAWTFPVLSLPKLWPALLFGLACAGGQVGAFAGGYWGWVPGYGLDAGGYFGFLGWTVAFVVGAAAHDAVAWARAGGGSTRQIAAAAAGMLLAACLLMLGGYSLSCLTVAAPAGPCYAHMRHGAAQVPCPTNTTAWVPPPLQPPPEGEPPPAASMWSMSLRSASLPFHLFTQGVALAAYALFYLACDVGVAPPSWARTAVAWARGCGERSRAAAASACLRAHSSRQLNLADAGSKSRTHHPDVRWRLRLGLFALFGDNALAVYLLHWAVRDSVADLVPGDAPLWYVLCVGFVLYFGVVAAMAAYLRRHGLFLRL